MAMIHRHMLGFVLIPSLLAGCGAPKVVPVSGRVTLDGKPLPNASVEFLPVVEGVKVVAPGSVGETAPDGTYSLYVIGTGERGAVVGHHPVAIYVREVTVPAQPDSFPAREQKQIVPARYGNGKTLSFDVLPNGSTEADFALTRP
jgi:hypothetical protein